MIINFLFSAHLTACETQPQPFECLLEINNQITIHHIYYAYSYARFTTITEYLANLYTFLQTINIVIIN